MKTDIETYQIDILKLRELNIDEKLPGLLDILNKDEEPSKKIKTFFGDIQRFDGVYFKYNENKVLLSKDRIKEILEKVDNVEILKQGIEYYKDDSDKAFEAIRDFIIKELYPNYSEEQLKSVYPNKDQIQKICMESANDGFTKNIPFVRSEYASDSPLSLVEVIIQDNGEVELHRQITNSLADLTDLDALDEMSFGPPNTTVYKGKLNTKAEYIELKVMDQSLDDQFLKKNKEGILKGCISQVTDKKYLELFNTQTKVTVQLLNDLKTEDIILQNLSPGCKDPAFLNHENGKAVLKETLYNPKFPLDKKKAMLNIIETIKGFENIKQEFIQNSVVHYLNDEFKQHKRLTEHQKKDISHRLYNEIITPLKMMFDKSDHSKLFKDLEPSNVEKLVRRCAREDPGLTHGVYGSLKTLIRSPLDGFGLEKDILSDKKLLNAFKEHVSKKTLEPVIPGYKRNNNIGKTSIY